MNTCKYCNAPILWQDRRPLNPDSTPHDFACCQAIRREAKLSRAREDRATLREQKARWKALQALAPLGTYLARIVKNPHTGETYPIPVGKVVWHAPFDSKKPLPDEHGLCWRNLGCVAFEGACMVPSFPPSLGGVYAVTKEQFDHVSDYAQTRENVAFNRLPISALDKFSDLMPNE